MSEYHYVFVRPGHPRGRLRRDISAACGAHLHPVDAEFIDYAAGLGHAVIEVELTHDYDADHGIPFGRHDSLNTVRPPWLPERHRSACHPFGGMTAM
ncbi:hypothetical protein [Streptomyces sp. NPDC001401]|uniref:hypothetical protein n=1 Tax=Streptomyces sp. NPDC001401 TaxID=3364570 RepID=UPI0036C10D5F